MRSTRRWPTPAGRSRPAPAPLSASGAGACGGLGADSRHAGLTCDALQSATVVLPSGDVVTVSPQQPGSVLGTARRWRRQLRGDDVDDVLRTFATGDVDLVRLDFPPASAVQVLAGWQSWLAGADRNTWGMVDLSVGANPNCHVLATCPVGAGRAWPTQSKPLSVCRQCSSEQHYGPHGSGHVFGGGSSTPAPAASWRIRRDYTVDSAADMHRHRHRTVACGAGNASVLVDPLGGAALRCGSCGFGLPVAQQAAVLQWYVEPAGNQIVAANKWLSSAHHAVQQYSAGGYVTTWKQHPASRFFGSNLSRMSAVRQKYDPTALCSPV